MPERDALPCPGCHTLLPPEATACPICMRARSKQEIVRGYAKLRAEKARKRRLPFQIFAAVLILGAGGKFGMTYRDKLTAAARSARGTVGRWADELSDPKNYGPKPAGAPAPPAANPPAAAPKPVPPEMALRTQLFAPDSPRTSPAPEQEPAPPPAAARPARIKPLAKNAWRVSGTVYDLATLDPVAGAEITFARDGKEPAAVTTNEKGAYTIDLVKGDDWTVNMKTPNHRRGQVLDIDPPYRVRDADERRRALELITDGDLIAVPVGWELSKSKVRLDLIAVPWRWPDSSRRWPDIPQR